MATVEAAVGTAVDDGTTDVDGNDVDGNDVVVTVTVTFSAVVTVAVDTAVFEEHPATDTSAPAATVTTSQQCLRRPVTTTPDVVEAAIVSHIARPDNEP